MIRRAYFAAALLLAACGSAADAETEPSTESPAVEPAPALTVPRETPAAPAAETPAPVAAPVATPAPAPAVVAPPPATPAPVVAAPAPAPTPAEPTPESPLEIWCVGETGCGACAVKLAAEHPAWADSGAARCSRRTCAADAECAELGADLVCLPDGTASGVSGPAVCRVLRLELHEKCSVDEAYPGTVHPCEPGLWCRPYGIAGLFCVEFKP